MGSTHAEGSSRLKRLDLTGRVARANCSTSDLRPSVTPPSRRGLRAGDWLRARPLTNKSSRTVYLQKAISAR